MPYESDGSSPPPPALPPSERNGRGDARALALVSCTGPSQPHPARAREHFTSPLFQALCTFADRRAGRWFLLSAEHGLLDPDAVIAPSALVLDRKDVQGREAWSARVQAQLAPYLPGIERVLVLANARSREFLLDFLRSDGRAVEVPLDGMSLGAQLQWLQRENGARS
ncbi:MAG TPA: hypothetical protein VFV33_05460 [Gemmatimonadaceae bacterium]|nr:hypothetical protein [Gemmatimonadaceae bacterium]